MANFDNIRSAKSELVLANLRLAVLFAPITSTALTTLEDPANGDLINLSTAGYTSAGIIEKGAGVDFGNDMTSTDIEAYGDSDPVRTIISKRTTTFNADFLETNINTLEKFWGTSLSAITPTSYGGVVIQAPALPKNIYYRCILLGQDDVDGDDLFMYWLLPKVKLDKVDNQSFKDDGTVMYKMTFKAFKDSGTGFSVAQGFTGPGWAALTHRAGFAAAPTAITAQISTTDGGATFASGWSLTASSVAAASLKRQAKVVGNNNINYTNAANYTSSNTAKATVDTNGVITVPQGATAGTATITATWLPYGATVALTSTQTVTLT